MREWILKFVKWNSRNNIIYQNLWYTAKVVLRGHFIAVSAAIFLINTESLRRQLSDALQVYRKEEAKYKPNIWKEIIKIMADIYEKVTKIHKMNQVKS